ncbi:MAG: hypothetical protein JNM69_15770 [Archangium sp.]|nr:hypothetical protein [Archangium sp.]
MASSGASNKRAALVAVVVVLAVGSVGWLVRSPEAVVVAPAAVEAPVEKPVAPEPAVVVEPAPAVRAPPVVSRGATVAERLLPGGFRVMGTVRHESGRSPAHVGVRCEAGVVPVVGSPQECRVVVECDGNVLYGAPIRHAAKCALGANGLSTVSDALTSARDADAAIEIDVASSVMRVTDESPGEYGRYSVEIDIDSVE